MKMSSATRSPIRLSSTQARAAADRSFLPSVGSAAVVVAWLSLFVVAVGGAVLVGWTFDISALKSLHCGQISMKPNAALCFILAGLALWLQVESPVPRAARQVACLLASIALAISLVTLCEYVLGLNLGIDELLFMDGGGFASARGRMAPATAICFAFAAAALLLLDRETRQGSRPAQWLSLLTGVPCLLSIVGYLYGARPLYAVAGFTSVALHTAVTLFLLAIGILGVRPHAGVMSVLTVDTGPSRLLRLMLPVIIILPIAIGWLRLKGQQAGWYPFEVGLTLFAVSNAILLAAILWRWGGAQVRLELQAQQRGRTMKESEQRFDLFLDAVKDYAIYMLDGGGHVITWPASAQRLKGYRREQVIGKHFSQFYTAEDIGAGVPGRELEIARTAGRYDGKGWHVRNDGSRFFAEVTISAVRDAEGTLLGFTNTTRDTTDSMRAHEQLRLALEGAPIGMILVDSSGVIVLLNTEIEKLFGYSRAELLGQKMELLVPLRYRDIHGQHRAAFFGNPRARRMGEGRDLHALRKDGAEVPVEIGLTPIQTTAGDCVLASVVDITQRKRAEQERETFLTRLHEFNSELETQVHDRTAALAKSLKEREVLLQEVHHRVKNNLQVISSLINMQMRKIVDPEDRASLEECQTRVQAIALIHEKLYQSSDYACVPFSEYVSSLAANVFHTLGVSSSAVSLALDIDNIALAVDKAIPCGLILNELITNALKHAFPGERSGALRVELKRPSGSRLRLCVADDGVGISPGSDLRDSPSLGMQLVSILAEQIDAEVNVVSDSRTGTRFEIEFSPET